MISIKGKLIDIFRESAKVIGLVFVFINIHLKDHYCIINNAWMNRSTIIWEKDVFKHAQGMLNCQLKWLKISHMWRYIDKNYLTTLKKKQLLKLFVLQHR